MNVTVSEDLNSRNGNPYRFCATLDGDRVADRAGFGPIESEALKELARRLRITPCVFLEQATIERVGVR